MTTEVLSNEELALVPEYAAFTDPIELFKPEFLSKVCNAIEVKAMEFQPSLETAASRKEIASIAHKVARSKTFLDNIGKNLVAEWKEKAKKVDYQRKQMRDNLDQLKAKVRAPLDEWEKKEKDRIDTIIARMDKMKFIVSDMDPQASSQMIEDAIIALNTVFTSSDFQEMKEQATKLHMECIELLNAKLVAKIQAEKEKEELDKLRAEKAEQERLQREQQERIEKLEREKREAEEKVKAEIEAKEKAEREAAEAVERQEEQARIAEIQKQKAEAELKEAQESAEKKKAEFEAKIGVIKKAIVEGVIEHCGLDEEAAYEVYCAIRDNAIPHVKIVMD